MRYSLERGNNQRYLLLAGLLFVFFYLFVYPRMMENRVRTEERFTEALSRCYKLDTNMCSKDCCTQNYWPVSFDTKRDPRILPGELGTKYIPTQLTCSGINGRGCVCVTNDQYNFVSTRGTNAGFSEPGQNLQCGRANAV